MKSHHTRNYNHFNINGIRIVYSLQPGQTHVTFLEVNTFEGMEQHMRWNHSLHFAQAAISSFLLLERNSFWVLRQVGVQYTFTLIWATFLFTLWRFPPFGKGDNSPFRRHSFKCFLSILGMKETFEGSPPCSSSVAKAMANTPQSSPFCWSWHGATFIQNERFSVRSRLEILASTAKFLTNGLLSYTATPLWMKLYATSSQWFDPLKRIWIHLFPSALGYSEVTPNSTLYKPPISGFILRSTVDAALITSMLSQLSNPMP